MPSGRRLAFAAALVLVAGMTSLEGQRQSAREVDQRAKRVGPHDNGEYFVASHQALSPAGRQTPVSGRVFDLALSPDGQLFAVKASHNVFILDVKTGSVLQSLPMGVDPKLGGFFASRVGTILGAQSFAGIGWSSDSRQLFNSDPHGRLLIAERDDKGQFRWTEPVTFKGPGRTSSAFVTAENSAPGGLAVIDETHVAVALSRNNSVAIVDSAVRKVTAEIPVGNVPFTVVTGKSHLYVSNWGGRAARSNERTADSAATSVVIDGRTGSASTGSVSVVDRKLGKVVQEIAVGLHPSAMALTRDGELLYVANGNADSVSVIDTRRLTVRRTLSLKPQEDAPLGSTPTALAFSPDENHLYVALAGLNAIAVLDVRGGTMLGWIPTAWYPVAVAASGDGSSLFVASLKGYGGRALDLNISVPGRNTPERVPRGADGRPRYNSHDEAGVISIIPVPSRAALTKYSDAVARNNGLPRLRAALLPQPRQAGSAAIPAAPGQTSPIKHVVYIIKENRTYDGVFGDLPQGNGDPSLCLYPRKVSPNHHALAEQFVLLDNLYVNGTLSAEGHMWANQGITSDYLERNSGGFARGYPFDGTDAMAFAASGSLWSAALAKGLTFRNYGEFVVSPTDTFYGIQSRYRFDLLSDPKKAAPEIRAKVSVQALEPHTSPDFAGFDMTIPDIQRAEVFLREFREFEARGEMPALTMMLLPNDHNAGMAPGYPTPRAMMADNDLALGRIVEAISKSRFWKETAIFVIEDDSQDGFDHVDGRRTVGLVISPYVRRKSVDHAFYNNNSMLRTMQLILGLPPLTTFDLISTPMFSAFQDTPDLTPFTALPNSWPLTEVNKPVEALRGRARRYAALSRDAAFQKLDGVDEALKNRIEWYAVKRSSPPRRRLD